RGRLPLDRLLHRSAGRAHQAQRGAQPQVWRRQVTPWDPGPSPCGARIPHLPPSPTQQGRSLMAKLNESDKTSSGFWVTQEAPIESDNPITTPQAEAPD